MRIIFLLNSLIILLFSFPSLYNLKNDFDIETEKNSYKLILKNQQFLNYKKIDGFKFFIPNFTKKFSLKILRFNSTGYINGYLSIDKTFSKIINDKNNIKYFFTDFKNGFELLYLLKGYTIPYNKVTSIAIDMTNIPNNIQTNLNKFIYFKRIPLSKNTLQYILYSCIITLDKKKVDEFVKKHFNSTNDSINIFLQNIYKINKLKEKKKKVTTKKIRKVPYALILTRLLFMKGYGYIPQSFEIKTPDIYPYITNIQNKLLDFQFFIKTSLNTFLLINPKDLLQKIDNKFNKLYNIISTPPNISIKIPKCIFNTNSVKKECFKNPIYFHNYIYYSIKNNSLPSDELILAYGDYKTFNDVGKYYFEIGDIKKAEIFLQKAYILAKNKNIPAHNLGVLYAFHSSIQDNKKAIKYFKEANLSIDRYNLGIYYYIGFKVKENDKIARKYFKSALDIPYAKYNFEIMKKYKVGIK